MNRMASVLVLSLVLLLAGAGYGWAAHTHAYVSLSDGTTAVNDDDDDWGVTCSSFASQVHGSATASSSASVTWNTSYPYWVAKTGSTSSNPTTTDGYQSTHSPTYAYPYEFDAWMYGAGVVAGCKLWLESIELVVPVGSPANFAVVDLDVAVDGITLAMGHFMLAGDGSYYGDGWYVDSFFDVFSDGDNWHGVYIGPPELDIELPVGSPFQFHFLVASDCNVDLPAGPTRRGSVMHTITFGYPDTHTLVENTVGADLSCVPTSGTVPFSTTISVALDNLFPLQTRRIAGQMNVTLANGNYFPGWRAGYTNVAAGESYSTTWAQNIPALGTVIGDNSMDLLVEDVTPAPYNQPPYPPAGDTVTASCVVTAIAP